MEGYFGPREGLNRREDSGDYAYEDWALVNEEAYRSRMRPRNLEITSSGYHRQKFHNVVPETPEEGNMLNKTIIFNSKTCFKIIEHSNEELRFYFLI